MHPTVALLAADRGTALRVEGMLSTRWSVAVSVGWAGVEPRTFDASVLLLGAPDLSDPSFRRAYHAVRAWRPDLPMVLCTGYAPHNLRHLVGLELQDLFLLGADSRRLQDVVADAGEEDRFIRLSRALASNEDLPFLCRRGLEMVCLQRPPAPEVAVERAAAGQVVYVRTVRDLASRLCCSPEYLSRGASSGGLRLGQLLRWVTFLRGMALHGSQPRWLDVAVRLGFGGPGAWTNFVRRLTGTTPSLAADRLPATWWARFEEETELGLPLRPDHGS